MEKLITIGSGRMGSLIAGDEAVSLMKTESFADFVFLATRQEGGLEWLRTNKDLLAGKVVISIMAFVEFAALEKAVNNEAVRFVRIMTDTSIKSVSWSDDGFLSGSQKESLAEQLKKIGKNSTEYLGERADDQLLFETLKACQLGWIAQALDEFTSGFDKNILEKVFEQYIRGSSFAKIAADVATPNGATEAGINASKGLFAKASYDIFRKQAGAGLAKAQEKTERFTNFAQELLSFQ